MLPTPRRSTLFPYTTLFRSGLPERVEGVIARALMKSSSDRYRSAVEMRADLLGETELWRSEEHTSELQSHSDLVCRLLLEKKNHICTISKAELNHVED